MPFFAVNEILNILKSVFKILRFLKIIKKNKFLLFTGGDFVTWNFIVTQKF